MDDQPISTPAGELPLPFNQEPQRVKSYTTRIVRDTRATELVKRKHDHACQACTTRIERLGGAYAEGVHIKPLGRPHNGPDKQNNILCLCPNCRVLFDSWAVTIKYDGSLVGALDGKINEIETHRINRDFLAYHRRLYFEANA